MAKSDELRYRGCDDGLLSEISDRCALFSFDLAATGEQESLATIGIGQEVGEYVLSAFGHQVARTSLPPVAASSHRGVCCSRIFASSGSSAVGS